MPILEATEGQLKKYIIKREGKTKGEKEKSYREFEKSFQAKEIDDLSGKGACCCT